MRISDWSSDVCSSDLLLAGVHVLPHHGGAFGQGLERCRRELEGFRLGGGTEGQCDGGRQARRQQQAAEGRKRRHGQSNSPKWTRGGRREGSRPRRLETSPGDDEDESLAMDAPLAMPELGRASWRERGGQDG